MVARVLWLLMPKPNLRNENPGVKRIVAIHLTYLILTQCQSFAFVEISWCSVPFSTATIQVSASCGTSTTRAETGASLISAYAKPSSTVEPKAKARFSILSAMLARSPTREKKQKQRIIRFGSEWFYRWETWHMIIGRGWSGAKFFFMLLDITGMV
jgi:hypothetical protein